MSNRLDAEVTPKVAPFRSSDVREITPRARQSSYIAPCEGATRSYGTSVDSRIDELRRLYASGEMDAALDLAAAVRPVSAGFSLASIPEVAKTPAELRALPLDHRAGFLLAHVDGLLDLETVLDLSPMPLEESLPLLEHLLGLGAIRLLPPTDL